MRYGWVVALLVGALAFVAAGCGGGDDGGGSAEGSEDVTGNVSMMAVWTGTEQENFQAVIDAFNELYPNVTVKYTSGGDNLAPLLSTAVQGGNPPDIATIAINLWRTALRLSGRTAVDRRPPGGHRRQLRRGRRGRWCDRRDPGTPSCGRPRTRSTIWYNVADFEEAGVEPPETWDELNEVASTLKSAGITRYSVGVDVGWPITDLFENIYIRSAGQDMYDQLANHEIPWTDQSVKDALTLMQDVVGASDDMVGGTSGAPDGDACLGRERIQRRPEGHDGHHRRLRSRAG